MQSLVILGRQPALGTAELESLYGPDVLVPISDDAVGLKIEPSEIDFPRLGGSIKLARVLTTLNTATWRDIEEQLGKLVSEHLKEVPDGKFKLGLSVYGLKISARDINATGLRLKKVIKAEGRSVRIVPNKFPELNSAQVLHNQLTSPTGLELLMVRSGPTTILAKTVAEQDIEAYAMRDQNRPMRDAKVGMLPPKLAQLLINLAHPAPEARILDPFCGTGVILQEAALMGLHYYGTDIDKRMVEYSEANLRWLQDKHKAGLKTGQIEIGDATKYTWSHPIDAVAAETFLGKPLTSLPPPSILEKIVGECDAIHRAFLTNIAEQLTTGTCLSLGVPAWKSKNGFLHLKTLDHLEKMGYTRKSFVHVRASELIYHRPDQVVARELVVLEKL